MDPWLTTVTYSKEGGELATFLGHLALGQTSIMNRRAESYFSVLTVSEEQAPPPAPISHRVPTRFQALK